jgi:membrane-associated phospholipid phosphatase
MPPVSRQEPRTGPRVVAAVVALVAAVGVHLTWRVFVMTPEGQRVEGLAFEGARHGRYRLWVLAEPVLDVVSVAFVAAGVLAVVLVALGRRRWMLAVQAAAIVAGSNLTTQVLKHQVYDRPHLLPGWTGPNGLPSGHTTVAASVSVAVLFVVPRRWRPLVAVLGAGWTAAMGVSTLVGRWHRPSDVVAAVLVVLAWGAAASALTSRSSLDVPTWEGDSMASPASTAVAVLLAVGGVAAGAVAAVALLDLATGLPSVPFEGDVTAYLGGAAGAGAVTLLMFAVLLLLRQATARPER